MRLNYVVMASVDRDDLHDGAAHHFVECVQAAHEARPGIKVEILSGRVEPASAALSSNAPDVFNHNVETVPGRYRQVRPGAECAGSLAPLRRFKEQDSQICTKSGLMAGLAECVDEIRGVMGDLRQVGCDMWTIGQYLAPSDSLVPVDRYFTPEEFRDLHRLREEMGFQRVNSGPLVRSSYHAEDHSGLI
jgi:lipoic acid synthetase